MNISATQLRAARAALFTALVVTLSAGSHVVLSRSALPLSVLAALTGAVFCAAYALAGRERGFGSIAALLVPLELAADTVFTTGQQICYGPVGGPVTGSLRSVGFDVLCGHPVGAHLPGVGAMGAEPGPAAAFLTSPDRPWMPWLLLAVHVSVGLLASAWLRRGESAVAGLVLTAAAFAFSPLLLAVHAATRGGHRAPGTVRRRATRPPRATATDLLVHSVGRRGPPAAVLGLAA
ncbi:hypothetical protein [Streptomyces fuscigenes]|uniref:hypothetical protein n=1 Tax=Streptomyces fuscigenes TaxID=1528880 RepID=UPI001F19A8A4|nr:hypothetical protein [Streptomyces fuscigenes]MCF3963672.1 hypothetical protein [Streptomyces fuscigenes]